MIKNIIPCLLLIVCAGIFKSTGQVVGMWIEDVDENPLTIILEPNDIATLIVNEEVFGGEKFEIDAGMATMKYHIKEGEPYNEIDITIVLLETGELVRDYSGIYEINNEGRMHLNMNFEGGTRPTTFDDENSLWLTNYE